MIDLERWTDLPQRLRGDNPWRLLLRCGRRFNAVRVPGLAAEISYYGLISLMPLIIALGASLSLLERVVGAARAQEIEATLLQALVTVFGPELAANLAPLVRGLLREDLSGAVLLGLLATLFFASAGFRAAIRALDDVYAVPARRRGPLVWILAYLLAVTSVLVTLLLLLLVVVGPLLGGGARLAEWLGLGRLAELTWAVGRWPLLYLIATAYLGWLYRTAPKAHASWRGSLPGALLATTGLVLIALGLRVYLGLAGPQAPELGDAPRALQIAGETIGAILAVALWLWLSAIAVLSGAVLNAELRRPAAPPASNDDI